MQKYLEIGGLVETDLSPEEWTDAFIEWIESRGEYFGGSIGHSKESEVDD